MTTRNNLLTPAQSAVYSTIMQGKSVIWLTGRQEGKTYVGVRCLEALSGVFFSGNAFQCGTNKQTYPDIYCMPPHAMRRYTPEVHPVPLELAVFDNFEMYDYQYLQDMLAVNAKQSLYMASHWSRISLSSTKFEIAVQALTARGVLVINS